MATRRTLLLVTAATLLASGAADARDRWTRPYPGVRHLHRTTAGQDWHALLIDLTNPRLSFVGTEEARTVLPPERRPARHPDAAHRWTRTSVFAREVGAEIAFNANYYDIFHRRHSTCGLTMSRGQRWSSTYDDDSLDCFASIGFGDSGQAHVFDSRGLRDSSPPFAWMTEVISGSPRLLENGAVLEYSHPRHALQRNPRTAVGLSADRRTLYVMVVNGREGHRLGMTCPQVARALQSLGASDAVNLDGGGSSALYIRSEYGVVSRASDGFERGVGNHLGIFFRDPPPQAPTLALGPAAPAAPEPPRAAPPAAPEAPRAAEPAAERGARSVPPPSRPAGLPTGNLAPGATAGVLLTLRRRRGRSQLH